MARIVSGPTERAGRERMPEQETTFDVVCGRGIRPDEAIASRIYRGETYYFCCTGCAEAFEADPVTYLREEPARAYSIEERRDLGPDQARVRAMEAEAGRYGPEIAEAERRARAARENMARLQRELEEARANLARRREELSAMATMPTAPAEGMRVAELEKQLQRERMEAEAAERALIEAREGRQAYLLRQRNEIEQIAQRERALEGEVRALEARLHEYEGKPKPESLRREAEEARSKLAQMQAQMRELGERKGEVRFRMSAEAGRISEAEVPTRVSGFEQQQMAGMDELARLEEAERALQADVQAQAARLADLEERMAAMAGAEREYANARSALQTRWAELESLGKRSDEIRAELDAEDRRVMELQRAAERERQEFEAARRALAEARARAEEIARRRRAEIAELQRKETGAKAGIEADTKRIESTEAQIRRLEDEARAAEARAAELREAEKRAQQELDRIRHERREVTLEGMPAIPGHEPGEFYRAEYKPKKGR